MNGTNQLQGLGDPPSYTSPRKLRRGDARKQTQAWSGYLNKKKTFGAIGQGMAQSSMTKRNAPPAMKIGVLGQ